jgi:hypothetical protein
MVLYGYSMLPTSNVMYSVWGVLGVSKDTWSVMAPTGSILFPPKPYRGFDGSLSCFQSKPILSKVARKRISARLPLSMRILVTSHLSMWTVMTIASVCRNEVMLMSWEEKVIGI